MNKVQLTQEGRKKLEDELRELQEIKRPEVVERLRKARGMGDLAENGEYSAAREGLDLVEERIHEIEEILKHAEVVENAKTGSQVAIGSTVTIASEGNTDTFAIVGEFEADPLVKKLSHTSPLGKALLGKKTNDTVEVETPSGKALHKILKIQ
ncbi:transcription elongation factor GreA [Candidatus Roizmanbacteria bacterium]|nr:transcription elongation factor GreA [Candidatus Roizmanbacteria bacterium]